MSARLQNTRQPICSDWKTLENQPANLHAQSGLEWILSKHFFSSGRRLSSSNCSFIVYCKRSSSSPTSFCWHVYAQPSRTITNWTNREARKKHRYQKLLSEKLTYFLATLLDIRTNVNAGYHILLRLEGEFLCNDLISMQFCFTCLIMIEKQCLLLPEGTGTSNFVDVAI